MSDNGQGGGPAGLSSPWGREGSMNAVQASTLKSLMKEVDSLTGRRQALVRTAIALAADERQKLTEAIARRFGPGHEVVFEVDPSLIGGVWLRVDDQIVDGSLRGRLEALRKHLAAVGE